MVKMYQRNKNGAIEVFELMNVFEFQSSAGSWHHQLPVYLDVNKTNISGVILLKNVQPFTRTRSCSPTVKLL